MGREALVPLVKEIRKTQRKVGGRKLYKMLSTEIKGLDVPMGRDQFLEFLREEDLLLRRRKRRVRTTMSKHGMPVYPDLLKHTRIERPGQVMVSDITYWAVPEGFYYVFLITDVCSHKIMGHYLAQNMEGANALKALRMAMGESRHALHGQIHHSDRGSQYVSIRYTERLAEAGIEPSVGSVGDSYDNALAETINGLYKTEAIRRHGPWRNLEANEMATREWVDWFNNRRLLGPIGNIPPAEAEANYYAQRDALDMVA